MKLVTILVMGFLSLGAYAQEAELDEDTVVMEVDNYWDYDLYPLALGNWWKYKDQNGDFYEERLVESSMTLGTEWFKMVEMEDGEESEWWVTLYVGGFYKDSPNPAEHGLSRGVYLKMPAIHGQKYSHLGEGVLIEKGIQVETPAGIFDSVRYEFSHEGEPYYYIYLAEGVGIVRMDDHYSDTFYELYEYEVN